MVQRLIKVFQREFGGLHEAAFLLGIFALLSQVLGLFRDRLLAHSFGAGSTLDVYYASFRIPDLLYASIASFVAVTVLIPFLLESLEHDDSKVHAKRFLNSIFTAFFFAITTVCIIVYIAIPWLTGVVAPGFTAEEESQMIMLSRLLLLSPILLGLSNLLGSVTQSFRRFFVYALAPVLYNAGIIFGILFFVPIFGVQGIVYGVILGALLHLLIQVPTVIGQRLLPRLTLHVDWGEVMRVIKLSLPRTLTLSAGHLATMVLVALASSMKEGSIAVFIFAMNLQSVPLSIVGVSYSTAAFPTLALLFSKGEHEKFLDQIATATRHSIFWSLPAMVLFIVLRAQIVRSILGSGKFDWADTRLTAAALAIFVVSLVAQALMLLFVRGYYAMGNTKKPLVINVTSSVFIVILGVLFMQVHTHSDIFRYFIESLLRVDDLSGSVILMLPLAYSVGMILNVVLLWLALERDMKEFTHRIKRTFIHSFSAAVFMGFVAYQGLQVLDGVFDLDTFWGVFLQGAISGVFGIIAGIFLLQLMGNKEVKEIGRSLHKRFWKAKPIAPDQREL